jgi:hypothetical protein
MSPERPVVPAHPSGDGLTDPCWSTELPAIKINEITGFHLHAGTVRRWFPSAGLVWCRAALTLHIWASHEDEKWRQYIKRRMNAVQNIRFL